MTDENHPKLPWNAAGARLHWPRDAHLAYVVGRMAVARAVDVWPLLYGSHGAGKIGFARLQKLSLLRCFPRKNVSEHAWYGLVAEAAPWVAEAMGCDDASELRVVHGISRMNLAAVRDRNRFWVSSVLAARAHEGVRVALVRAEWELRRARSPGTMVVPDLEIIFEVETDGGCMEATWFVEFDAGTERLSVIEAKAKAYLEARASGALYGELGWRVLALVPSVRRARGVAAAVARVEAGDLFWVAVTTELEEGRAFDRRLWRGDELAAAPASEPRWSLVGVSTPARDACPQPLAAADRGAPSVSREESR